MNQYDYESLSDEQRKILWGVVGPYARTIQLLKVWGQDERPTPQSEVTLEYIAAHFEAIISGLLYSRDYVWKQGFHMGVIAGVAAMALVSLFFDHVL